MSFPIPRPRGTNPPIEQKGPSAAKVRSETRVLNAAGRWQAYLRPSRSIVIEDAQHGRESVVRRQAIVRAGL